jgi:hypothetical protein
MYRLTERVGKRTKEEDKSGMGRIERMKLGSCMKGRDDRSIGIEILMSDVSQKSNRLTPVCLLLIDKARAKYETCVLVSVVILCLL